MVAPFRLQMEVGYMKVIVGLGNPGRKYEVTRHNIGFITVDHIADELDIDVTRMKWKGLLGEGRVQGEKVILFKPQTYMNKSGEAVRELIDFYDVPLTDVLFIYDDLDLPSGKIKLRTKGSAGGHNGVKSLIQHLGTKELRRIKMGVGRPDSGDVVSYVLGQFPGEEQEAVRAMINMAVQAGIAFCTEEFSKVMNMYNGS
jgi:peptidyl-tRNA hydrolase, PTH1 family